MRNTINLLLVLLTANMLSFTGEAAAVEPAKAANGGGGLRARTSVKRGLEPVADLASMTREELEAKVAELTAKQSETSTHSFRFNDGKEATLYEAGDKMFGGGIAKGGEVKSARDTGTISIYGFGQKPISLYPNSLIELAEVLTNPDGVVAFIVKNEKVINEYLRTRPGFKADRLVRIDDAKAMLAQWHGAGVEAEPEA